MLRLISHNPFRILGVFGNASKKDILSSENKIKAFLTVDKDIRFPLDSIPGLPTIKRDLDVLANATKEIERPVDELKSLLFWFIEQTPVDKIAFNHLTSGDIHKAVEIWSEVDNLSSRLNRLTAYTILEDWKCVAQCADALLSNRSYVNDICNLVSDTIRFDSPKLIGLYLDAFCGDSPDSLWKIYRSLAPNPDESAIDNRVSTEWNTRIRETLASHFIKRTGDQLDEVLRIPKENLLEQARKMLRFLKQTDWDAHQEAIGNGVELSILRDKVASKGIQIAIDLYNNWHEPAQVARMALELAQLALEASVKGGLIYQRCEENIKTLKNICSELPPVEVVYYDKLLKPIIDAYQNKPSAIDNAADFINACAPYLMSVRSVIGANHEYYIKTCTHIAAQAIYDIISDFNEQSERQYRRLEHSLIQERRSIIEYLRNLMKKAVIAMFHLEFLGLDPDFKTNWFDKNFAVIVKQARAAKALGASLSHSSSDEEVSESDFFSELNEFPLDQRDEDGYFSSIKSLSDCYLYRKLFPDGKYTKQVDAKEEEYEYHECATLADLVKFKVRYPSTKYDLEKKREEIILKNCKTIEDYESYLSEYSIYKNLAISRIDDLLFEQCKNRDDYANYLKRYPDGRHWLEAQRKLDELDYGACTTLQDFERYVQNYPYGLRVSDAQKFIADEKAWLECVKKDNWKAYETYLSEFPSGRHVNEAKAKAVSPLEKFKEWRKDNGCLFFFIIIVILAFIIAGIAGGITGIGYVFALIALGCIKFAFGKKDIGCITSIGTLIIAGISAAIAAGLIFWGEEIARETRVEEAMDSVSCNPTISDYEKLLFQYGADMNYDEQQAFLEKYYNASLDLCHSTIHKYSYSSDYASISGLGYLKKFALNSPDASYRNKAESKYTYLVDSLYKEANALNTYEAWDLYQESVSTADYRDSQAKKEATRWSTDDAAWQTASNMNSIDSYQKYLDLFPSGKHKSSAERKIIDLQVDIAFSGEHGQLPKMNKTSYGSGSTTTLNIYNDTNYSLTLLYSGKESKKLELAMNSRRSITLKNGQYRIVASVPSFFVRNYVSLETFDGGEYDIKYYIDHKYSRFIKQ